MRVFIAIPIPLLILGAIVLNGVTDKDPALLIPPNIETASIKDQVEFGDRARRAKSFDLAIQYCEKGIDAEAEKLETQMVALTCMMRSHKGNGNIDEALAYAYRVKEWDESQGFGSKYVDDDIAELNKLK
jgi:hypothetical protein